MIKYSKQQLKMNNNVPEDRSQYDDLPLDRLNCSDVHDHCPPNYEWAEEDDD